MKIEVHTTPHKLQFHQNWADYEEGEYSFRLTCGAGLGGRLLGLHLCHSSGQSIEESIDVSALFEQWLEAKMPELKAIVDQRMPA